VDESLAGAGLTRGEHDGIQVAVTCRGGERVEVDRRQMKRVLTNLLTNAREALGGAGHIDLLAEVAPAENGSPGQVRFEVRDDGRGMSDEFMRTALFRPFSTTKSEGLGLGLAQSRSIVEAHGGRIRVVSRPGDGTTFEVTLPMPSLAAREAGNGR
jgi:hypothetical protein